ncbi:hypothetical protein [Rhodovulum sp. ES.010]|uniref:hypothetical protein n=1 Tax=Rhodovulum sp. ES.010 TaxID=1882821 RepID=UPI000941682E|nr:hypothetical protein [Rhodovulum sp. ES.010]
MLEGTEVSCQCQDGMEEIGSFGPPDDNPDDPEEKMCGMDLSGRDGIEPPDPDVPPSGGGGGDRGDEPDPELCHPDDLLASFKPIEQANERCIAGAADGASATGIVGGTSGFLSGLVFVNPGVVAATGWTSVFAALVQFNISSDRCAENFCADVKNAMITCGYPVAIYATGASGSMCRYYP